MLTIRRIIWLCLVLVGGLCAAGCWGLVPDTVGPPGGFLRHWSGARIVAWVKAEPSSQNIGLGACELIRRLLSPQIEGKETALRQQLADVMSILEQRVTPTDTDDINHARGIYSVPLSHISHGSESAMQLYLSIQPTAGSLATIWENELVLLVQRDLYGDTEDDAVSRTAILRIYAALVSDVCTKGSNQALHVLRRIEPRSRNLHALWRENMDKCARDGHQVQSLPASSSPAPHEPG